MTNTTNTLEMEDQNATLEDLIAVNEYRAQTYGFLARLYRSEIDEALLEELHNMHYRVSTGSAAMDEGHKLMATYLSGLWENSLIELSADFSRTFIGHGYNGHSAAYPFESVYASEKRLLMQGARDEVLALYRAEGVDKRSSWREGEDHIALELEFMQYLSNRVVQALKDGNQDEAYRLVKCQFNFMEDHLGAWVPLLTEQMKHFAKTKFYQSVAYMTEGFIENDEALMRDLLFSEES